MYDDMYEYHSNRNAMAAAAVVFGLISIFSCLVIYIALPAGALAFLFALLSRTEPKMTGKGKAGIICGLLGMILTVTITVFSFYFVFTNDTARAYLNQYFKYYTGDADMDFEEELNNLLSEFGFSSDIFSSEESLSEDSYSQDLDNQYIPENTEQNSGSSLSPDNSDSDNHFIPDTIIQEEGVFL